MNTMMMLSTLLGLSSLGCKVFAFGALVSVNAADAHAFGFLAIFAGVFTLVFGALLVNE